MSEQQELLTPNDSVSNASKKKSRPGKAQRQAARAISQASATTGTASIAKATMFAGKMISEPNPQPGRHPVVFPAGAGEPTRGYEMAIDSHSLRMCLEHLPSDYVNSARFTEFAAAAEYTEPTFSEELVVSSLLAIAQHVVHAHQNMGLPLGDFSAVSTTDIYNPSAVRAVVRQFGEFAVDYLGTRYLYKSYEDEITALVRTAKKISATTESDFAYLLDEHWLPTRIDDSRTKFILATKVQKYFAGLGLTLDIKDLTASMFTKAPSFYEAMKSVLPNSGKSKFDKLFTEVKTKKDFTALFNNGSTLLKDLGLSWRDVDEKDLVFAISPKIAFPELAQNWLRRKPTITKFFVCGTGSVEKAEALGSPAQLGTVDTVAGVTVVRNLVAISAPEFSLLACFPCTAVLPFQGPRNVVLTTALSPRVRATEFIQRDWC